MRAGFRRVRRNKSGIGQELLPRAAELDQVVAIGAVAMKENDELARLARARLKPRAVKLGHQDLRFILD